MKNNRLIIMLAMLATTFAAGCGSSTQTQEQVNNNDEATTETATRRNPVFSLFDSDGNGSYQLYRNKDKIAVFSFEDGRKPIEMCSHNDDCYILVSETPKNDTISDTLRANAEIYKNGRRVMELDERLKAMNFAMEEGHFYVLGKLADSGYTVYRDGLRILTFPKLQGSKPIDMHVFGQTVYVAMQRGKTTDIYKDNNKLYSIDGVCKDIKVSFRGVYLLTGDTLFLDRNVIMFNEYYRHTDKEMYAFPTMLATNDKDLLVGARASFDKQHTYAGIFLNQQTYTTVKPDDKHIGDSEQSTVCCGVAISNETYYYATTILSEDMSNEKPITYYFHTDHNDSFTLKFENDEARLLMMTSD